MEFPANQVFDLYSILSKLRQIYIYFIYLNKNEGMEFKMISNILH